MIIFLTYLAQVGAVVWFFHTLVYTHHSERGRLPILIGAILLSVFFGFFRKKLREAGYS